MGLEELRFGQVITLGEGSYQLVRTWDGATVRVASMDNGRERKLLRYNGHGAIVMSDQPASYDTPT